VHLDIALAGLIVGVIVGMTGMGGGALMTPILVLGFGIQPLAAVSSDLVASVVMKPIGGGIHFRRGTVHTGLVRWLALGSVPSAFLGAYLISHVAGDVADLVRTLLGVVLLVAAAAMVVRAWLSRRRTDGLTGADAAQVPVRRVPTLLIGVVGGLVVGTTSVGSGSLMIVALMLMYPRLSSKELVGTDLVQAIPLVLSAALGHVVWGDLQLGLTSSLLLGCIPGVVIGALVSSVAPDAIIRPILTVVLAISAVKLLGASDEVVGALLGLAVLVLGAVVLVRRRRADEPVPARHERSAAVASTR
jgi:uncharacterized membrane protein YfcA